MNDWLRNKVVFIWDLFFYFLFFWAQSEAGGGEGHADQKIESCLSTTWYDTVDNAVPCGKSVCSPESPPSEKQSGKETKRTGIGSRVSEIQSDADPLVDFFFFFPHYFWTGIEGHIRQRSPSTNCPSGPRLLKRLGAGESQLKVLGVAFFLNAGSPSDFSAGSAGLHESIDRRRGGGVACCFSHKAVQCPPSSSLWKVGGCCTVFPQSS